VHNQQRPEPKIHYILKWQQEERTGIQEWCSGNRLHTEHCEMSLRQLHQWQNVLPLRQITLFFFGGGGPCQTSRSTLGKTSWVKYRCSPFRKDKVSLVLHAEYQTVFTPMFPNQGSAKNREQYFRRRIVFPATNSSWPANISHSRTLRNMNKDIRVLPRKNWQTLPHAMATRNYKLSKFPSVGRNDSKWTVIPTDTFQIM